METEDEGDESLTCEVGESRSMSGLSPQVQGVVMPFKSDKQRRYMFKFHPKIALKWAKEVKAKRKKKK